MRTPESQTAALTHFNLITVTVLSNVHFNYSSGSLDLAAGDVVAAQRSLSVVENSSVQVQEVAPGSSHYPAQ